MPVHNLYVEVWLVISGDEISSIRTRCLQHTYVTWYFQQHICQIQHSYTRIIDLIFRDRLERSFACIKLRRVYIFQ